MLNQFATNLNQLNELNYSYKFKINYKIESEIFKCQFFMVRELNLLISIIRLVIPFFFMEFVAFTLIQAMTLLHEIHF